MRVMLVAHRFPPDDLGGVEQYTQTLATELAGLGDSVSVVARRSDQVIRQPRMIKEQIPGGITLYRLLAGGYRPERFLDGQPELTRWFTMAAIESAPEVVHVNHLAGLSPQIMRVAHRLGAAVVVSLHDFHFACPRAHLQRPTGELCQGPAFGSNCAATCFAMDGDGDRHYWGLRTMYFQRALQASQRVIAYSQYVASYFQPMCAVPIRVIENGVLPNCVLARDIDSDVRPNRGLKLAYCGTVAPHKGPHLILAALRLANLEGVCLRIIGNIPDPTYGARIRETAAHIPGLKIQTFGKFSRNELPLLLRDVDCVIVPSLVPEAGPIVPREAMACGIPVLASRLGALPELITEGENGFTFDPRRPEELAALLCRLAREEGVLSRLRAGARHSRVVTSTEHTKLVREVYEQAIAAIPSGIKDPVHGDELQFIYDALLERERQHKAQLQVEPNHNTAAISAGN